MRSRNANSGSLVEVARGRLKPLRRCSAIERRRAFALGEQRVRLLTEWTELVEELGEAWIPRTGFVLRMGVGDIPANLTVPEIEAEVEKLKLVREMKRCGVGSVN